MARTESVCGPGARLVYSIVDAQDSNAPSSRLHSKDAGSLAVNATAQVSPSAEIVDALVSGELSSAGAGEDVVDVGEDELDAALEGAADGDVGCPVGLDDAA